MPLMPRFKSKGSKVCHDILGTPPNLVKQRKSERDKIVNARLNLEETRLVR